ncbi:hypothetical protein, partial [Aeromonas salmonicida]|uniref:hypothetical protein n=1 Tax=Aeromonas salmonicida TaxID=645 RepID=UPI0038B950E5
KCHFKVSNQKCKKRCYALKYIVKNSLPLTQSLTQQRFFTCITLLIGNESREALFMQGLFLPVIDAGTACGAIPV